MKNTITKILEKRFHITDSVNFDFKSSQRKSVSNFKVRGSLRSQLGKFLPSDQFDLNKKDIEANPLP